MFEEKKSRSGEIQWRFTNHTFSPGEIISLPNRASVIMLNCINFPKEIDADFVSISECDGVSIDRIKARYVGISQCRYLKNIGEISAGRSISIGFCPEFETLSLPDASQVEDMRITRCRKFKGDVAGRFVELSNIARLPNLQSSSLLNSISISHCGFQNPDVVIEGVSSVTLLKVHCRSVTVSAERSVYIGYDCVLKEANITARKIEIVSKHIKNINISPKAQSIYIKDAKKLKQFYCSNNYNSLNIVDCSVVFPLPNKIDAHVYANQPHPDQKNYLFFEDTYANGYHDYSYAGLFKLRNNEVGVVRSGGESTISMKKLIAYGAFPRILTYRGFLKRKIVLWAEQPYENS